MKLRTLILILALLSTLPRVEATHAAFPETQPWQQVSGNATTQLTGGCNAATTGFCTGTPTINASTAYYFILGAKFDSAPGGGSTLATIRDPVSGLRHFAVTFDAVVESTETGGSAHLIYHRNVSATQFWSVVRFVPASTAAARMDGFNSAVKHPLQGWTESGTTGLYHRYSSDPSSTTVGYLFQPTPVIPCEECVPFFGEEGSFIGDRSDLATAVFGRSEEDAKDAISFLFGLFLVAALAAGGASLFGMPGAAIGAVGAAAFNTFNGWWPLWVIILVIVMGLGALAFFGRGRA